MPDDRPKGISLEVTSLYLERFYPDYSPGLSMIHDVAIHRMAPGRASSAGRSGQSYAPRSAEWVTAQLVENVIPFIYAVVSIVVAEDLWDRIKMRRIRLQKAVEEQAKRRRTESGISSKHADEVVPLIVEVLKRELAKERAESPG